MELNLAHSRPVSWPDTNVLPARWPMPIPRAAVRLAIVLALYTVTVLAIHGAASGLSTRGAALAPAGMCHRR